MKKKMKRAILTALFLSLCMAISGCTSSAPDADGSRDEEKADGLRKLEIRVISHEENGALFDISMDAFIDSFNSFYERDHEEEYLPESHEWSLYNAMAVHGDNEVLCRDFSRDQEVRAVPTISVHVPTAGNGVQQIMVSYDDHSYSIPTYEMYQELCFYALKTMMPDLADEEVEALSIRLNELADENITDVPYGADAVPYALYHMDGVGVYPYYAAGEEIHFCIIPVTEQLLDDLAAQGTRLYEAGR